jgi:predicted dienelactone hydrolase
VKHLTLALLLLAATAVAASDETALPAPTGPYATGTTSLVFVDETRPELFTEDETDRREVTVRVWYPATPAEDAVTASYYDHAGEIIGRFGYPGALADLKTHSVLNAPVAEREEGYPAILFNHGWGEHALQNTALMEELASHGYVVFSLAHHHEAKFWVYPDGRIEFLNTWTPRFMKIMGEQNQPEMMSLFQAMFTTRGVAAQESLFRRTGEMMPTMLLESPRMWAGDIRFVIGELDSLDRSDDRFGGVLDLDRLGVMGMSMGGIAAAQACIGDSRIKASINIDGGLFGDLPGAVLDQPAMFMGSRRFIGYDSVFAGHVKGDACVVTVAEADHYDFSDFTLLHRKHAMIGTVEGLRMIEIVNAYTLGFFDHYLKGEESDLIAGDLRPYPEVEFHFFRKAQE